MSSALLRSSLRSIASSSSSSSSRAFFAHTPYALSRFASSSTFAAESSRAPSSSDSPLLPNQPPVVKPVLPHTPPPAPAPARPARAAPRIRATKAALTLTPDAVLRLRNLISGPTPQLIRIGVKNKGCAGMQYHLEYVEKPGKFDEIVEQDGVRVLIDSKALFSIIGSEMHWQEDRLSSKFVFKNPNIVDACGCGESFNVASTA